MTRSEQDTVTAVIAMLRNTMTAVKVMNNRKLRAQLADTLEQIVAKEEQLRATRNEYAKRWNKVHAKQHSNINSKSYARCKAQRKAYNHAYYMAHKNKTQENTICTM